MLCAIEVLAGERGFSVRHLVISGAPLSESNLYQLRNVVPVHNVFGLTTNVVRNQFLKG
jgi:hypothetical protein